MNIYNLNREKNKLNKEHNEIETDDSINSRINKDSNKKTKIIDGKCNSVYYYFI